MSSSSRGLNASLELASMEMEAKERARKNVANLLQVRVGCGQLDTRLLMLRYHFFNWLVLCPRKKSGTVSLHFGYVPEFRGPYSSRLCPPKNSGMWTVIQRFDYVPEFFQFAIKPLEPGTDRANSADAVFTHTVYKLPLRRETHITGSTRVGKH